MSKIPCVRSSKYREVVDKLKKDPIIVSMAGDIDPGVVSDSPTEYGFMIAALNEYHRRGGTIETHIGGPAEAIKELLNG